MSKSVVVGFDVWAVCFFHFVGGRMCFCCLVNQEVFLSKKIRKLPFFEKFHCKQFFCRQKRLCGNWVLCGINEFIISSFLLLLVFAHMSYLMKKVEIYCALMIIYHFYDSINETVFLSFLLQTEISKRLSAIITQIVPFLQQEHQQQVLTAVERAKQITMSELNAVIGVSSLRLI